MKPAHAAALKVVLVALPVLITSYFTYKASVAQSSAADAAEKAKIEANNAHTAKAIEELQAAMVSEIRFSSELKGRIDQLERRRRGGDGEGIGLGSAGTIGHGAGRGAGAAAPEPTPAPTPTFKPRSLPKGLDQAQQMKL